MNSQANKTVPFRCYEDISAFRGYLADNCDPVYLLIFDIAIMTGLRISDVLRLKYSANVFGNRLVVAESKGRKAAIAKLRNKILEGRRRWLMVTTKDDEKRLMYSQAHISTIYGLLSESMRADVDYQVDDAVSRLKIEKRHCLIPDYLAEKIRGHRRQHRHDSTSCLFQRGVLRSNRCRLMGGNISRQRVWVVFRDAGRALGFDFPTSCHGLRKTFALFLYRSTGNDGSVTIKEIGWKDEKILQRYLSVEDGAAERAVIEMQASIVSTETKKAGL